MTTYLGKPLLTPAQWAPESKNTGSVFVNDGSGVALYQGAFQPWSLSAIPNGARFEVRPGDQHWWDATHNTNERSELAGQDQFTVGQPFMIVWSILVERGPVTQAAWQVIGQLHQDLATAKAGSPPVALELSAGDYLSLYLRFGADGTPAGGKTEAWRSAKPVTRSKRFQVRLAGIVDPKGGRLKAYIDGALVQDYRGPLGYDGMASTYFSHGLYRAHTNETIAIQHSGFNVQRFGVDLS